MYTIGPAYCRLLELLEKNWRARIENGEAPSEILLQTYGCVDEDLSILHLPERMIREEAVANDIRSRLQARIDALENNNPIHIQLLPGIPIQRSFNPMEINSLGDGRLIHADFLILQIPGGSIELRGEDVFDNIICNEVIFPDVPHFYANGNLEANVETAKITLHNVRQTGKNHFQVLLAD
jgi:hypothetical protein